MNADPNEAVVLCEGFHDRAFWAEILRHLDCNAPSTLPGTNPWGETLRPRHFGFHSRSRQFIRVVPVKGNTNLSPEARIALENRLVQPLRHLVVSTDLDSDASGVQVAGRPFNRASFDNLIKGFDSGVSPNTVGDYELDDGKTKVSFACWQAPDAPMVGIPPKQTLERLVCAAMIAAYPERGPLVQKWLDSRPTETITTPKSFAWSYLAGWYGDAGSYEAFFPRIWADPKIAAELIERLKQVGVWRIADALVV